LYPRLGTPGLKQEQGKQENSKTKMNKSKYKLLQWQNWKICTSQMTAFTGTEAQSDANFPATQQTHIAGKTSL